MGGTQTGRYSFLGSRPTMEVMAKEGACSVLDHERGERTRSEVGAVRYCSPSPRHRLNKRGLTMRVDDLAGYGVTWAMGPADIARHVTRCHVAQRNEALICVHMTWRAINACVPRARRRTR